MLWCNMPFKSLLSDIFETAQQQINKSGCELSGLLALCLSAYVVRAKPILRNVWSFKLKWMQLNSSGLFIVQGENICQFAQSSRRDLMTKSLKTTGLFIHLTLQPHMSTSPWAYLSLLLFECAAQNGFRELFVPRQGFPTTVKDTQ